MANSPQAKKRIRVTASKTAINRSRVSRIRTFVKNVEEALAGGDATAAAAALKVAEPEVMRGVNKGVMHQKTASRKISRLTKRVKALVA
jgi:small subunit ribosomal protein S20